MPCTEKRARILLQSKRAVVHKMHPFTIRLKNRIIEEINLQFTRLKIDPGSKTTGITILREGTAIMLLEIKHKPGIKKALGTRRALRHGRRNRKTRYRRPRFLNRKKPEDWLPPSLMARVNQTMNVVNKLRKLIPISAISVENVKFDTQLLQNPNISGVEYQQGTLAGYEVGEYLLEKWKRECGYCGKTSVPFQKEHVIPRNPKSGPKGTDRISNLTIACDDCNNDKDNLQPEEWLEKLKKSNRPIDKIRAERLPKVLSQLKQPLKDAAMMNATRWRLYEQLKSTGLPIEAGTGARTKMQRIAHGLPKTHYYDACCAGATTPSQIIMSQQYVQVWASIGRGSRKMCNVNKYGFPISHRSHQKSYFGFQTGDLVRVDIPSGRYQGRFNGRVAVRMSGYFDIKNSTGKRIAQGITHKYINIIQRSDGWAYEKKLIERKTPHSFPQLKAGLPAAKLVK